MGGGGGRRQTDKQPGTETKRQKPKLSQRRKQTDRQRIESAAETDRQDRQTENSAKSRLSPVEQVDRRSQQCCRFDSEDFPSLNRVSSKAVFIPCQPGRHGACLTSQQHTCVFQERICSDNCTCCPTETEVADQTLYLTKSQYTDTWPTSPSADPTTPGAWQGRHWGIKFYVAGWTRPGKRSKAQAGIEPRSDALEAEVMVQI